MAKEIERISVNKFEEALNKNNTVTVRLYGTEDIDMIITTTISFTKMVQFVEDVVSACVDVETGSYVPEAYDFAIRIGVLTYYANFTMPQSIEKQYLLVYNTGAFEQIQEHINQRQFADIVKTIDKKIKFLLDLASSAAVSKLNEVIAKIADITNTGAELMSGLDTQSVEAIANGFTREGKLDEEALARAFLKVNHNIVDKDTVSVDKK